MNWEATLDQYTATIGNKLEEHLKLLKGAAGRYHPFMLKTYENLEEYILRKGKRLASCSTLMTYKGYKGEVDEKILNVCMGIELYRHCVLIHDDLVDEDEARRGGRSFHKLFSDVHGARFGEGTAIFMGDAMYALSLETILKSGFGGEVVNKVIQLLVRDYRDVNESQVLDSLFEHKEPDVEEWYTMASKRASSLFRTTILAGAIPGGAPEEDLRALENAATNIGYAFDIQDDIIDTFAAEEQYGRSPGGDIAKGKKPLHLICALKLAGPEESAAIKSMLGKGEIGMEDLEKMRAVIRKTGALDAAKKKSIEHAERAKVLIDRTKMSEESKKFFNAFIDYIVQSLEWYK
jgi:geranylgeranyl diphosphate synthase type II